MKRIIFCLVFTFASTSGLAQKYVEHHYFSDFDSQWSESRSTAVLHDTLYAASNNGFVSSFDEEFRPVPIPSKLNKYFVLDVFEYGDHVWAETADNILLVRAPGNTWVEFTHIDAPTYRDSANVMFILKDDEIQRVVPGNGAFRLEFAAYAPKLDSILCFAIVNDTIIVSNEDSRHILSAWTFDGVEIADTTMDYYAISRMFALDNGSVLIGSKNSVDGILNSGSLKDLNSRPMKVTLSNTDNQVVVSEPRNPQVMVRNGIVGVGGYSVEGGLGSNWYYGFFYCDTAGEMPVFFAARQNFSNAHWLTDSCWVVSDKVAFFYRLYSSSNIQSVSYRFTQGACYRLQASDGVSSRRQLIRYVWRDSALIAIGDVRNSNAVDTILVSKKLINRRFGWVHQNQDGSMLVWRYDSLYHRASNETEFQAIRKTNYDDLYELGDGKLVLMDDRGDFSLSEDGGKTWNRRIRNSTPNVYVSLAHHNNTLYLHNREKLMMYDVDELPDSTDTLTVLKAITLDSLTMLVGVDSNAVRYIYFDAPVRPKGSDWRINGFTLCTWIPREDRISRQKVELRTPIGQGLNPQNPPWVEARYHKGNLFMWLVGDQKLLRVDSTGVTYHGTLKFPSDRPFLNSTVLYHMFDTNGVWWLQYGNEGMIDHVVVAYDLNEIDTELPTEDDDEWTAREHYAQDATATLHFSPNPASTFAAVRFNGLNTLSTSNGEPIEIQVRSVDGRIVDSFSIPISDVQTGAISIDVSDYPSGSYFVRATNLGVKCTGQLLVVH